MLEFELGVLFKNTIEKVGIEGRQDREKALTTRKDLDWLERIGVSYGGEDSCMALHFNYADFQYLAGLKEVILRYDRFSADQGQGQVKRWKISNDAMFEDMPAFGNGKLTEEQISMWRAVLHVERLARPETGRRGGARWIGCLGKSAHEFIPELKIKRVNNWPQCEMGLERDRKSTDVERSRRLLVVGK